MHLDFLQAADDTPLTKQFALIDDKIDTRPYPFIKHVTSHREAITDVEGLHKVLEAHAAQGHCLLKGLLTEQVIRASRAGKTRADDVTRWVLLDLDFQTGWSSLDDFIRDLNPDWSDVSYVFQHSASAGIKYEAGLRGHLWILLDEPIPPSVLKQWLKERNLSVPQLQTQITLATNGLSLKWPLDITTCQSDKLIYIAPPVCEGTLTDPLEGQRFIVQQKARDFAPAPKCDTLPATIEVETDKVITKLRNDAGLPKRSPKMSQLGSMDVLTNPEVSTVTGVKEDRGFVYLNLNGGDSWGYFFPVSHPEFVRNFKGEPIVRLRDIAPDFYHNYVAIQKQQNYGDLKPFVFREVRSDTYFNLLYKPSTDSFELAPTPCSSKERLSDFMAQFGYPMPDPVEDWQLVFDPTTTKVLDAPNKWVNKFQPTDHIRYKTETHAKVIPPVINKVLDSLTDNEEDAKEHLINWLAHLFQTRKRTDTAWIFHGIPGTGKGLLLDQILRPLFGRRHITEWTTQNFEEMYNAALEDTLFLWLDEFQAHGSKSQQTVMNKLKNYITENEITIRGMRSNSINVPNYLNVIIATNHTDPVQLDPNDRRFNVAPPQETPLSITEDEVLQINDELLLFASYLAHYDACAQKARTILKNKHRDAMIDASQTSVEQFFNAVRKGNLEWFLGFVRHELPVHDTLDYQQYEKVLLNWCRQLLENAEKPITPPIKVLRDDLITMYRYVIGSGATQAKFSRMCSLHRLPIKNIWNSETNRTTRGLEVDFHSDIEPLVAFIEDANKKPNLQLIQGQQ